MVRQHSYRGGSPRCSAELKTSGAALTKTVGGQATLFDVETLELHLFEWSKENTVCSD